MRALLRPKLTAKIVLLVLLPVLLLSAALAGSTLVVLRETARQQLDERLALNLGVAWEVLRGKGKDLRFDEGQLKAGDFALNDSTEVVDKVAALVGGVCSIFMGDERVSTTVRGDGGVRVVGSKLGQGPVYESLFTRHQGFRGEAMVLGDPYLTAYDPIFDKDGAILGSLVVGVRKAEFLTSVERTERLLLVTSILAALLASALALAVARRVIIRPVVGVTRAMEALAAGNTDIVVPKVRSADEIAEMVRTLEVFRANTIEKHRLEEETRQAAAIEHLRDEEERHRAEATSREVADLIEAAARGDLTRRIVLDGKKGQALGLCSGINSLLETLQATIDEIATTLSAVAEGDLTRRITGGYGGAFLRLKEDTNRLAEQLGETVGHIVNTSIAVRAAANHIADGSDDLAKRSESSAANLEEAAAAMEELTVTARLNADNAQQAEKLAFGARKAAESGGGVVDATRSAMTSVERSSHKISEIIALIDEIAFQTNLLALNAAVEAARAGEAGTGFAVVAVQVRALAGRSAEASREIKKLIQSSNRHVEEGVRLVGETGSALDRIVGAVKEASDLIAAIAAASREQANSLDAMNVSIATVDDMTRQNVLLVEESTTAVQSLAREADRLVDRVAFFRTM